MAMYKTIVHYASDSGWPYHTVAVITTGFDGIDYYTVTNEIINFYEKNDRDEWKHPWGGLHMPGEQPRQLVLGTSSPITMVGIFSKEAVLKQEGKVTYTDKHGVPLDDNLRIWLGQRHLEVCLEYKDPNVWWRQVP